MADKLTKSQKNIYDALEKFIKQNGYPPTNRELASILGISATSVHEQLERLERKNYIRRTKNRARSIELVSNENKNTDPVPGKLSKIPLLGTIAAGLPILAEENRESDIFISDTLLSGGNFFALNVKGDSMIKAGIHEGDIIVVRQQPVAQNGDIVAALIENEATVKRLKITNDRILLLPENDSFLPMDVTEREDFRILGKVVHWISNN